MKKILMLEEFLVFNEINNEYLDEEFSEDKLNYLYEKITLDDVHDVQQKNIKSYTVAKTLAWVIFFPVAMLWELESIIHKKIRIKTLIDKETDPAKKLLLKGELEALQTKEIRYLHKIDKARTLAKEKANSMKTEEIKSKENAILLKKKEIDKVNAKIKDIKKVETKK